MMELTKSQKVAYDAMKSGKNVFITGGAGTGKTKLIQEFISEVDPNMEKTIFMAPTGKAALNMGENGRTIHRTLGLRKDDEHFDKNPAVPKILDSVKRIVIDEISMMRIDLFDYFARLFQKENRYRYQSVDWESNEPLRMPIQLIMVGDFYQLNPVMVVNDTRNDETLLNKWYGKDVGRAYSFQSDFWHKLGIQTYELTEICRQKGNPEFAAALNQLRVGNTECIHYFNENCIIGESNFDPSLITLCGKNKTVEKINNQHIPANKTISHTEISKKVFDADIDWKSIACEKDLVLFPEAHVMCIANNKSAVNGEMGVIKKIYDDEIIIRWNSGKVNAVEKYTWSINRPIVTEKIVKADENGKFIYEKIISSETLYEVTQFPLKLAYASTVHKAQGETISDGGNVYLGKTYGGNREFFNPGQLYTALSRFTDPRNIHLSRPLIESDVIYEKLIYNFFNK